MAMSRPAVVGLLLFLGLYGIYLASPVEQRTDSVWVVHTATSIVREGNGDVDEYSDQIDAAGGWKVIDVDGHRYYDYPTGVTLAALPFVVPAHYLNPDFDARVANGVVPTTERAIASFYIAATAVLLYWLALSIIGRSGPAVIVALLFGLGTAAWSLASRALWQHGPSMFLLSVALALAYGARRRPGLLAWAGPVVVLAYFTRPTNLTAAVFLLVYVAIVRRDQLVKLTVFAAVAGGAMLLFNQVFFGEALPSYFGSGSVDVGRSNPGEALIGNLVSPSRGIFVFSPVLLLAAVGIWLKVRSKSFDWLDGYVAAVVVSQWLLVSFLAPVWWSGFSFGQRFLADIVPYLVWFLIPVVAEVAAKTPSVSLPAQKALIVALTVTGLASIFINARGATAQETFEWNRLDRHGNWVTVHEDDSRIWDWTDLQFLRGFP